MVIYLIIINSLSIILYGVDKILAIYKKWRIPEKTLLLVSFFGGCFCAFFSMFLFNHKVRKLKFNILNSVFIIIWIFICVKFFIE